MIGGAKLNEIIARDNTMSDVAGQLTAWDIDSDEWTQVSRELAEGMAPRFEALPLDMALQLAWGSGFLIGYAARLEVEMQTEADAYLPEGRRHVGGPTGEQLACPRCNSDTYEPGTLDYAGCSDCKEADSE